MRKMTRFSALLASVACSLVTAFAPATAHAEYPDRPIKVVVGFAPGGGVDLVARAIAPVLQKELGQSIVVENRAGAGGAIGNTAVARAAPDGYMLLLGNTGALGITPVLLPDQPYDMLKDLVPVGAIAQTPLMFLVRKDSPYMTFNDLAQAAKQKDSHITYGTGGNGSISHLIAESLKHKLGLNMEHVAYRGGSQSVADLIGGQIDMAMDGVAVAGGFLKSGDLRALAITSQERLSVLPQVPTLVEQGYAGEVFNSWYAVLAPKDTPPAIVARLNDAINKAIADPALQRNLQEQQGASVMPGSPQDFGKLLASELKRWSDAVQVAGLRQK